MNSNLISRQVIEGELNLDGEDITIKSASVVYLGQEFKKLDIVDSKVQFDITEQFENGNYEVHWNVIVNGVDTVVKDSFVVSNDKIDPTVPADLQSLA